MKKWILTGILIAFLILFICLKSVWHGFVYFAIAMLMLLCLFWIAVLIYEYIDYYYKNFENNFKQYKAEEINSQNINTQEFEEGIEGQLKNFKKSLRLSKFIDIFKIIFIFTIFVIIIVTLFRA